jgi:DNA-binding transcriptional LysR family regulator
MSFRPGQLEYFLTVAEEGQVTRAARRLNIAQPALSQAIARLEEELGLQLLDRQARGVTLTPAGEAFLPKARKAVECEREVERTARSLSRMRDGRLLVGFIGPPPAMTTAEPFAAFAAQERGVELSFLDLPFPRGTTDGWLAEVDAAFCHPPAPEAGIRTLAIRSEPRAVVMHRSNPLAGRRGLTAGEVLDETFISYHPDVQPDWAGFHCLDDHRGGPPHSMTSDRASTALQMLGLMSAGHAVTVVPSCDGRLVEQAIPELTSIPLPDAAPALLSLVWAEARCPPLLEAMLAVARVTCGV